jgi:mRNA interferase RelE/StbE
VGAARKYEIRLTPHAHRSLKQLRRHQDLLGRIDNAIRSLAKDPRPKGYKKLASKKYDNLYRIRVGDWRILYAIQDDKLIVLVLDVVRRDQAYR